MLMAAFYLCGGGHLIFLPLKFTGEKRLFHGSQIYSEELSVVLGILSQLETQYLTAYFS